MIKKLILYNIILYVTLFKNNYDGNKKSSVHQWTYETGQIKKNYKVKRDELDCLGQKAANGHPTY